MKFNAPRTGRNRSRPLLLVPLAALSLITLMPPLSYAAPLSTGGAAKAPKDVKAPKNVKAPKDAKALPNVTLPYTFVCPDCGLKITIKAAADWKKDCPACACGKTSLGCYHDMKK